MGALLERRLGVVADRDVGEARDLDVGLPLRCERLPDLRRRLLHELGAPRAEDEAVRDARRPRHRLLRTGAGPDRRPGVLNRRRADDALVAIRLACLAPDVADAVDLPFELGRAPREVLGDVEQLEVVLAASLGEPEHEPAAGELVDDRGLLRDEHLVPRR
jgi:hypothetical protein